VVSPFSVEFTEKAAEEIGAVTKPVGQRLLDKIRWMADHFEAVTPAPLSGDLAGVSKLRVGDYRVLYTFNRDARSIRILRICHRRDVYRNP